MWHWGWKLSNNFCNFLFALIQPGQAAGLVFQRGLHRSWCLTQSTLIFFHCRNCWSGKKKSIWQFAYVGSKHYSPNPSISGEETTYESSLLLMGPFIYYQGHQGKQQLVCYCLFHIKVIVGAYKVDRNIRGYFIYMTGILFCAWKAKGCVPST